MKGAVATIWGLAGVGMLLTAAVVRLSQRALAAWDHSFAWYHWATLAGVVLFMAHSEGYHGFQLHFSPRVAARARYLRENGSATEAWLAPLFLMCYFRAPLPRLIVSYGLTAGIIVLVVTMSWAPQPWRGIVDVGVAVGLTWGIVSLAVCCFRSLTRHSYPVSPDLG